MSRVTAAPPSSRCRDDALPDQPRSRHDVRLRADRLQPGSATNSLPLASRFRIGPMARPGRDRSMSRCAHCFRDWSIWSKTHFRLRCKLRSSVKTNRSSHLLPLVRSLARAAYETAFPIRSAAKFSTWRWISSNCRLEKRGFYPYIQTK